MWLQIADPEVTVCSHTAEDQCQDCEKTDKQAKPRAPTCSNNQVMTLASEVAVKSQEERAITTGNHPNCPDKSSPVQSSGEEEEEEEERDTATGGERESASKETTDKEVEMKRNDAYGVKLTGRRTSSYENVLEYSTI